MAMFGIFKRRFDGPLQKLRQPIKDPVRFHALSAECMLLLASAIQAPGKSMVDVVAALQEKRHIEGLDLHLENYVNALAIADELIKMEPLRGHPWTMRAQALVGLQRYAEALAACERAIEIDPSDPAKWREKSDILRAMGRPALAEQAEQRASELGT